MVEGLTSFSCLPKWQTERAGHYGWSVRFVDPPMSRGQI